MVVGWTPSFLSTCYPRASRNLIASFVKDIRKLSIGLVLALYVTFGHENFLKGPANLFTQALPDLRLDGLLTLIAMTFGRLGDLLVLLRYSEQLQGPSREFNAQLETASFRKMKDWRILLLQYLLQQKRSVTKEDKMATGASECKQYCGMPLLTDLALMMRIDPLALVHGLREFFTLVYGPVMSFVFPDVQKKAYRNSVFYVNLVSVVNCSVLNWVEQKQLRDLASNGRLIGRIAEPGWMLMDFNNNFKCRMGREDLSHVQLNPKLWNQRPVVMVSGEAMRVPLWPEAYAHVKENQQNAFRFQAAAGPMPPIPTDKEDCVGSHVSCHCRSHRSGSRCRKENAEMEWRDGVASSVGILRPCTGSTSHSLMLGVERRSRHHLPGDQGSRLTHGTMCIHLTIVTIEMVRRSERGNIGGSKGIQRRYVHNGQ